MDLLVLLLPFLTASFWELKGVTQQSKDFQSSPGLGGIVPLHHGLLVNDAAENLVIGERPFSGLLLLST